MNIQRYHNLSEQHKHRHDNKFTVPSDGYYKLTVDLNALTLLVEQGDPTAIEEVSAAVKPVVTVSGSTIQVLTNGAVVDDGTVNLLSWLPAVK